MKKGIVILICVLIIILMSISVTGACDPACESGQKCVNDVCVVQYSSNSYGNLRSEVGNDYPRVDLTVSNAGTVNYNPNNYELSGKFGTIKLDSFRPKGDYQIIIKGNKVEIKYKGYSTFVQGKKEIKIDKTTGGIPKIIVPEGVDYELDLGAGGRAVVVHGGKTREVYAPNGGKVSFLGKSDIKIKDKNEITLYLKDEKRVIQSKNFYYEKNDNSYTLYQGNMADFNYEPPTYFSKSTHPIVIFPGGNGDNKYTDPEMRMAGAPHGFAVVNYNEEGFDIKGPLKYGMAIGDFGTPFDIKKYRDSKDKFKLVWEGFQTESINKNFGTPRPGFPEYSKAKGKIEARGLFKLNIRDNSGNKLYDFSTNTEHGKGMWRSNELGVVVENKKDNLGEYKEIKYILPSGIENDPDLLDYDDNQIINGNMYAAAYVYNPSTKKFITKSVPVPAEVHLVKQEGKVNVRFTSGFQNKLAKVGSTALFPERFIMHAPLNPKNTKKIYKKDSGEYYLLSTLDESDPDAASYEVPISVTPGEAIAAAVWEGNNHDYTSSRSALRTKIDELKKDKKRNAELKIYQKALDILNKRHPIPLPVPTLRVG